MAKKPFGSTLDEALWRYGASSALAEKLGISRGYLCDIRKGRDVPPRPLAERISAETGVPLSTLLKKRAKSARP